MAYKNDYERPSLTVDCVVFGVDLVNACLNVVLIERDGEPFAGRWALPGGFVARGETAEQAAARELEEETGLRQVFLEQLYTFSRPDRDPRGWVVSVAYYALVAPEQHLLTAATDARQAQWFNAHQPPALAFDHAEILQVALRRLRGKVLYAPIGFELLPKKFSLKQLQSLYEIILGRQLDNRNFRKKILRFGILRPTHELQRGVAHRAAQLYKFDERRYRQLAKQGWSFEI